MEEESNNNVFFASFSSTTMNSLDRATLAASTDMVRLLFDVPGVCCWGSFACSHARIPGRMYAITTSVLFYSNVFGFERRFCLNFSDIVDISLHRTTSLRFELANDEVYIFRSFPDRKQVLALLVGLRRLSTKDRLNTSLSMVSAPHLRPRSDTTRTVLLDVDLQHQGGGPDDSSSLHPDANSLSPSINNIDDQRLPPCTVPIYHRPRALSDSVVRMLGFEEPPAKPEGERSMSAIHEEHRSSLIHTMSAPILDSNNNKIDPHTAWEMEKAKVFTYENTGVEDVRLNCTLDDYYELFLADKAPHSFVYFQSNVIADKDVTISAWTDETEACGTFAHVSEYGRKLTFTHPIKSSIGPSEARTQRSQSLKRFSSYGMILRNSTQVTGIPAADCFKAEDFWIIEAMENQTLLILARFAPRFHKRTMLKGLIERSIKRETTEWFRLYFDMVRTTLEERVRSGPGVVVDPRHTKEHEPQDTIMTNLTILEGIHSLLRLIAVLLFAICVFVTIPAMQTIKTMILFQERHDECRSTFANAWDTMITNNRH